MIEEGPHPINNQLMYMNEPHEASAFKLKSGVNTNSERSRNNSI